MDLSFPIGVALDGRWRIVEELRGVPDRGMYRGRGRDGEPVLVTMTNEQAVAADQQRRALALDLPGITPLLAITTVEVPGGRHDVLVEAEPAGAPLAPGRERVAMAHVAAIGRDLAAVLRAAHEAGVVVGVLRPEIVYVAEAPEGPRVTAIAPRAERFFRTSKRLCHGVVTPFDELYEAPETSRTTDLEPASDVFSLSAILAHLVAGAHPFAGEGLFGQLQAILRNERRRPVDGVALPPIIDAGLAPDPRARPSLGELERALAANA